MGKPETGFDNIGHGAPGQQKGSQFYVYYLTCFATIGGLLFGYDTGIVSGSMLLIGDYFDLNTIWKELIVSATVGAAAVFALIAGFLNDLIGRKKVVMLASLIFTAGAIVMGAANGKEMLLIGRLIVGAGIGKIFRISSSAIFGEKVEVLSWLCRHLRRCA